MNQLYPLKFKPHILDKMWGGKKLKDVLHKPAPSVKAGESWEISGIDGMMSVVSNGFLKNNSLKELIEIYMGDLTGDRIFERFGLDFPLLIKFIDANDNLSIQVHPDNDLALKRHNSSGKSEMWYIMQADPEAALIVGFNRKINKDMYLRYLKEKKLTDILNYEPVKEGDVLYLPAGRVHAIGAGILLAEIQQSSDITYRIYDFDRIDADGKPRQLHTDQALDAIDYSHHKHYKTQYTDTRNTPVELVNCKYFTARKLDLDNPLHRETHLLDCFVIYICLEGSCRLTYRENERTELTKGETILIPAMINNFTIIPKTRVKLLEVYIDPAD